MRLARIALLVTATGCAASTAARRESSKAAAIPNSGEPLHITIVYPDTAEPIQAQDSSFLFGSVGRGRGDVALSINGFPVHVAPNGSWLAWIPLPSDSLGQFRLGSWGFGTWEWEEEIMLSCGIRGCHRHSPKDCS